MALNKTNHPRGKVLYMVEQGESKTGRGGMLNRLSLNRLWPGIDYRETLVLEVKRVIRREIRSMQCRPQLVSLVLISWTVIYPVDSAIQSMNNRGLNDFI